MKDGNTPREILKRIELYCLPKRRDQSQTIERTIYVIVLMYDGYDGWDLEDNELKVFYLQSFYLSSLYVTEALYSVFCGKFRREQFLFRELFEKSLL